ncbi:helix-turn-helix domain-containing protein [Cellulosimicrobium sp. ES-005]|uniref:Helix-turn-helix domain-containing protein n=1 Tax=Cellulosimicrobium sp. ES-005 TaxID=3163031 RepID=A0AAU8G560_9MICO
MSTGQAAELLGMTDRGVRLAISEGRLEAEKVADRYRISRSNVEHYRAARAA